MTHNWQDLIAEARRLNHEAQATIDGLLATAKPAHARKQRSAKARIRAVVEAARAVGIDPQTIEIDGVKISAGDPASASNDRAVVKLDKWLEKNAR
jgi:hypothetical protein